MCRSFVSLVDNARELQASLAPEEADMWRYVWDRDTCMSWDTYLFTTFAGELVLKCLRELLRGVGLGLGMVLQRHAKLLKITRAAWPTRSR